MTSTLTGSSPRHGRLGQAHREWVVGLHRIAVGLLFAQHGVATLFGVLGGAHGNHGPAEFGAWPSWWAGVIQLGCGALVVLGVGSRSAAFLGSGSMAYAYFVAHQPQALMPIENGGVPAALYCWSLLLIAAIGPGAFALENLWRRGGDRAAG